MPQMFKTDAGGTGRPPSRPCWCWILLMLAALAVTAPMAGQKGKPLAVKDVMDLLQGSVPSTEITRIVQEDGISFHMTDELASQFREAGATDDLIDVLRRVSPPEASPPPPTGTLKVQSQPGDAQVYVNDELKGTTNSEGIMSLSGLATGTYHLRVARGGYKVWENTITVTAGETVDAFVTLEKQNLAPSVTLDADRNSIETGQDVYLRWTSTNATDVDIEPGVGRVALSGSTSVSPRQSTTYTLTAIGPGGIKTATTYVSVTAPPPPPPPAPVVRPAVGNLPGFPVPGANFRGIKFFESGYNPPPVGRRSYQMQFNHRNCRFVNWELNLEFPPVASRINFTIYATWYSPNGSVFANQTVNTYADPGWTTPVYNSGRGWQRPGMWKRGAYRVELYVNGSRIGTGYFAVD